MNQNWRSFTSGLVVASNYLTNPCKHGSKGLLQGIWRVVNFTELLEVINTQFWEWLLERSVNAWVSPQVWIHYCLSPHPQLWIHTVSLLHPSDMNTPTDISFPQVWVMAFSFDKTGHWKEELMFQLSLSAWDSCLTVGQVLWDVCRIFANLQKNTIMKQFIRSKMLNSVLSVFTCLISFNLPQLGSQVHFPNISRINPKTPCSWYLELLKSALGWHLR